MEITPEIIETIDKIAKRLAPKFTFAFHDRQDIFQELRIIALDGLRRYKPAQGPLENFLATHMRNRIMNFKRDNYFRRDKPKKNLAKWEELAQRKISLLQPVNIEGLDEHFPIAENHLERAAFEELIERINKKLPAYLRTDFLRMCDQENIPASRRMRVQECVLEIIQEEELEESNEEDQI